MRKSAACSSAKPKRGRRSAPDFLISGIFLLRCALWWNIRNKTHSFTMSGRPSSKAHETTRRYGGSMRQQAMIRHKYLHKYGRVTRIFLLCSLRLLHLDINLSCPSSSALGVTVNLFYVSSCPKGTRSIITPHILTANSPMQRRSFSRLKQAHWDLNT